MNLSIINIFLFVIIFSIIEVFNFNIFSILSGVFVLFKVCLAL